MYQISSPIKFCALFTITCESDPEFVLIIYRNIYVFSLAFRLFFIVSFIGIIIIIYFIALGICHVRPIIFISIICLFLIIFN